MRDENGIVHRKVEFIHDPRLIRAYVKRKKQIEDELLKNADVDEILPTNDKELNKIRRKALEEKLANLEKRAKQSRAKTTKGSDPCSCCCGATIIDANTVMLPDGSYVIGGKGIGKGKSRTRRCKIVELMDTFVLMQNVPYIRKWCLESMMIQRQSLARHQQLVQVTLLEKQPHLPQ